MDILLDSLKKSIEHLAIIDKVLSTEHHPNKLEYMEIKGKINKLNKTFPDLQFTELLYVGGKKGSGKEGYQRQMILSDIIEYVFFGRGYYYVGEKDPKRKSVFIKLILNTINLLLIIDSLTVEATLRKKVLNELEKRLGSKTFFKSDYEKICHQALAMHTGDINIANGSEKKLSPAVVKILKQHNTSLDRSDLNNYYDSLLPKTAGGLWNELIVFFNLLRRTSMFIIPLLLTQRILSKDETLLKPPDYLVIDKEKQLFGVEVGGKKESQSGNFTSRTGSRIITVQNTQVPPRCPICGKWILLCPKVIEDCSDIENNPLLRMGENATEATREVRCAHDCKMFNVDQVENGECPYIQYHGNISEKTKKDCKIIFDGKYHFHYSCIIKRKDSVALKNVKYQFKRWDKSKKIEINALVTDYPYVSGLYDLENLEKNEIVCYGKYNDDKLDRKNCKACKFMNDCIRDTKLTKISELTDEKINKLIESIN